MSLLYLVTESDRDAIFYQKCAERFGGRQFSWCRPLRNRKGDGSEAVRQQLKFALMQARQAAGGEEEVCFIAAIDNDRAPHAENHATLDRSKLSPPERDRAPRLDWMMAVITGVMGQDRAQWMLRIAAAVPVEMLESWTVKALNADQPGGPMPRFSWQHQQRASEYYRPIKPPLQWKDLENGAREACAHVDDEGFYEHVVHVIAAHPQALRAKSPSFEHFHDQLAAW